MPSLPWLKPRYFRISLLSRNLILGFGSFVRIFSSQVLWRWLQDKTLLEREDFLLAFLATAKEYKIKSKNFIIILSLKYYFKVEKKEICKKPVHSIYIGNERYRSLGWALFKGIWRFDQRELSWNFFGSLEWPLFPCLNYSPSPKKSFLKRLNARALWSFLADHSWKAISQFTSPVINSSRAATLLIANYNITTILVIPHVSPPPLKVRTPFKTSLQLKSLLKLYLSSRRLYYTPSLMTQNPISAKRNKMVN